MSNQKNSFAMRLSLVFQLTLVLVFILNPDRSPAQRMPISLHPQNPHYFLYRDKPTILITSAEHYGAVLNLDFDYITYLDELKSKRLNLTRTFTGAYLEPSGAFNITANVLAPKPAKFICPWLRSEEPGHTLGGNKFDLTRWDPAYFERLRDFVSSAEKRGIIVELALFCPFYKDDQWIGSPMYAANNINGLGNVQREEVYTMDKHGGLYAIQEAMVRKIVHELQQYGNVIYEICNEPYFGGVTMEWQHQIASVIDETEKELGVRHLISQNIANHTALITNPHPAVSLFNFHYASPPVAVVQNYHLNKAIGNNETGFRGQQDSTYRKEGWEFILAGGALYNNLDYSFTADHEGGDFRYPEKQPGGGSTSLRTQLGYLADFINSFTFVQMKPDSLFIADGLLSPSVGYVLAEPGQQYAVYLLHAGGAQLSLQLPSGRYKLDWLNPVTGVYISKDKMVHKGGMARVTVPENTFDIALRIVRKK
jgi:hypothetical protein